MSPRKNGLETGAKPALLVKVQVGDSQPLQNKIGFIIVYITVLPPLHYYYLRVLIVTLLFISYYIESPTFYLAELMANQMVVVLRC